MTRRVSFKKWMTLSHNTTSEALELASAAASVSQQGASRNRRACCPGSRRSAAIAQVQRCLTDTN